MIEYRSGVAIVTSQNGGCRPATVEEAWQWRQIQSAHKAIEHYEAALMAAFPDGATGEAFDHWSRARKEIA